VCGSGDLEAGLTDLMTWLVMYWDLSDRSSAKIADSVEAVTEDAEAVTEDAVMELVSESSVHSCSTFFFLGALGF